VARDLSIADVAAIIEPIADFSGMMLIGGQALNYWAETLGIADAQSSGPYGPATSEDIDMLGSVAAVRSFAKALNVEPQIAGFADAHSPNSGMVTFEFDGATHSVDFLAHMAGFAVAELPSVLKWAHVVSLSKKPKATLRVMHPMHCLQAQLENIYGEVLNRRDSVDGARYASRVRMGVEATRRIAQHCATTADVDTALVMAEHVHQLSYLKSSLRARYEDGIEVDAAIYRGVEMPEKFLTLRVPQMERLLALRVKRYQQLRERIKARGPT